MKLSRSGHVDVRVDAVPGAARTRRGRPVWQVLAVLVLLPVLAAGISGGVSVASSREAARQAAAAQRLVASVELLDAARRSVDAELLPTMLLMTLDDADRAADLGFPPARRAILRSSVPAQLARTRATTDEAMDAAAAAPADAAVSSALTGAQSALRSVRGVADRRSTSLYGVGRGYQGVATALAGAQRRASAEAVSAGLSPRSVAALADLDQVLQLSQTGSRQLAQLFASRVLPEPMATSAENGWLSSWGSYSELLGRSDGSSSAVVRGALSTYAQSSDVSSFTQLLDRQALTPRDDVIETGALPGLVARSGRRDDALSIVLDDAVVVVTDSARADREAASSRERALGLLSSVMMLVSLADAVVLTWWLSRSLRGLAASARQVSQGHLVDVAVAGPRELRTAAAALSAAVAGLRRVQQQARAVVAGDLDEAVRQQPLPGPLGDVVHASVEQIVEAFQARQALQDELAHQATHDALTGLPNRAQTLRDLASALARGRRSGRTTGVLFIDLDGFKAVNDTHGHAAGDELLRQVAGRLASSLRAGDSVGRLGGDEFVVTLEDVADVADLVGFGERLIAAVSLPVPVGSSDGTVHRVAVGASIGIAVSADAGTDPDALLAEADTAAYRAKRLGRGRVEVFDDSLRAELAEHADLAAGLRAALDAGELTLAYQPILSLRTGALLGHEALARWTRADGVPVAPAHFIAAAEASSLVCDVGRWALAQATAQQALWRAAWLTDGTRTDGTRTDGTRTYGTAAPDEPSVAVNLSARHVGDPRVLVDVADALAASGLPARLLVVEVTEAALVSSPRAAQHLQALRDLGVRVAVDDVGTGVLSIAALATAPVDAIKLHESLTRSQETRSRQVAALLIRAAATFGLFVVAEGLETDDQLQLALADGCHAGQGFLLGSPRPPAAVHDPHRLARSTS